MRLKKSVVIARNRIEKRSITGVETPNLYNSIRPYVNVSDSDYEQWDKLYMYDTETHFMIRMPGFTHDIVSLFISWTSINDVVESIQEYITGRKGDFYTVVRRIVDNIIASDMMEQRLDKKT
ncbi:hypothetical protein CSA37_02665 [Candidatus Fermentibacteria bacterium]|nr:MAG: hypothetical protein CSA37_09120 [Candidatus Fermentibacteria bacterium]PIE53261.1 MAG: hypothetical protein CSA37_02665 [Candidatus Fermentibacteria bacterium]